MFIGNYFGVTVKFFKKIENEEKIIYMEKEF